MAREHLKKHLFTRRAFLLSCGKGLLAGGLLSRMGYLQLWQATHYKTMARDNSIKLQLIAPKRGLITDCKDRMLVENVKVFRLLLTPEQAPNPSESLLKLSRLIPLEEEIFPRLFREMAQNAKFLPLIVKENLTWDEVAKVESHSLTLPGISIEEGYLRAYPYGTTCAHILGYVQAATAQEAQENRLFRVAGVKIGRSGLEKQFCETLRGRPGYREVEVNAQRKVIRQLSEEASQTGQSVKLSLDITIQKILQARLAEEQSASAVIMDATTGEVLAMVSSPTFDNNDFVKGISTQKWKSYIDTPYNTLSNKALTGQYAPGSAFKLIIALAALDAKVIIPSERITCHGKLLVGNHPFHCWKKGHGSLNLIEAISHSCDIYFYELAQRLGIEKIAAYAYKFGFGQKTGIELPGEKAGLVPQKSWKKWRLGKDWTFGETVLAGIGQGYLLSTPLQLTMMMARLVTGRLDLTPTLLPRLPSLSTDPFIQNPHRQVIMRSMEATVNHPSGTAYKYRIADPKYAMAGKTSTTQTRRISLREREENTFRRERAWKERDHASFVGYAPLHNPKYVLGLVVEHGGWGKTAAKIGHDVLLKIQQYGQEKA